MGGDITIRHTTALWGAMGWVSKWHDPYKHIRTKISVKDATPSRECAEGQTSYGFHGHHGGLINKRGIREIQAVSTGNRGDLGDHREPGDHNFDKILDKKSLRAIELLSVMFQVMGMMQPTADILPASWAMVTQRHYTLVLNHGYAYCKESGINPTMPTLHQGAHNTMNHYYPPSWWWWWWELFGKHQLVTIWIGNLKPSLARYEAVSALRTLLEYLWGWRRPTKQLDAS